MLIDRVSNGGAGRAPRALANLRRTLNPRSIAVIGDERGERSVQGAVVSNLLSHGFRGQLLVVNSKLSEMQGIPTHRSVAEISAEIDLAVITNLAPEVIEIAKQVLERGAGGIVVTSSGFSKADQFGNTLEDALVELTNDHQARLIGPGALGIINSDLGLSLHSTYSSQHPLPGHVALMSQSGSIGLAAIQAANTARLGISMFVSVGNSTDVQCKDLISYWNDDPNTSMIMLHLESFGNARQFSAIARQVAKRKPIIAVKSHERRGESVEPNSLFEIDEAANALFSQCGVVRVDTIEDMIDVALLLDRQSLPSGNNVAVISNSRGPGIMTADLCKRANLELASLSQTTGARLRSILPTSLSAQNPVDLSTEASAADYEAALSIVLADDNVDSAVVVFTRILPGGTNVVARAIESASKQFPNKPISVCFLGTSERPNLTSLATYSSLERAVHALDRVTTYANWRHSAKGTARYFNVDTHSAHTVTSDRGGWLTTGEICCLLQSYGIPTATCGIANNPTSAISLAESIGFPVVAKSGRLDLTDKAAIGALQLNLHNSVDVGDAVTAIGLASNDPNGPVIIQPMITSGVEVTINVKHDPDLGPTMMFGLAGIATDLLGDRAYQLLPMTDTEAHALVRSIKGHPIFFGYKNRTPVDVEKLEELMLRISQLIQEQPSIEELNIDPLIVKAEGAIAINANIKLRQTATSPTMGTFIALSQ